MTVLFRDERAAMRAAALAELSTGVMPNLVAATMGLTVAQMLGLLDVVRGHVTSDVAAMLVARFDGGEPRHLTMQRIRISRIVLNDVLRAHRSEAFAAALHVEGKSRSDMIGSYQLPPGVVDAAIWAGGGAEPPRVRLLSRSGFSSVSTDNTPAALADARARMAARFGADGWTEATF